jgi:WD40 repeat protein
METVAQAALPPDSTRLATVSPYGRARLWRLPEGDLLATYDGRVDGRSLAVSAAHLAAGDRDGVHLWRLEATGASAAPPLELPGTALALAFSPDGRLLAVGRDGGGLDVWLLPGATGDAPQPVLTEAELGGPAALLAFAPDGARLAVAAGERIQLYRLIRLATLWDTPLAKLTVAQLAAAQADLPATAAGDHGRAWVDFSAALLGWRGRFDIALGEPGNVRLGEFDIALGPEAA